MKKWLIVGELLCISQKYSEIQPWPKPARTGVTRPTSDSVTDDGLDASEMNVIAWKV